MKHLVIGQRLNAPDFSAFHWSPRGNLVSIGQHLVITRVVHLPKRTETSLIKLVSDLISESDQAVRAVHSCNSWFCFSFKLIQDIMHLIVSRMSVENVASQYCLDKFSVCTQNCVKCYG